ncbi:VOC family protein [Persicitalea jodogahamensis]|uniref:VOC family protein n=1 Tax=Persicitalea jodogahamensis TaxID=402147 RepID=A0A8J3G9I5_9BACT|nr:VOC family protein [Persicitalea jodogahamensis]GHB67159.1 VOC family protein [Persicitalea jodogahamensis]
MPKANIYLNFDGTAEEAFKFYQSVFGGEFAMLQRFSEIPDADKIPDDARDRIMHIALPLSPDDVLMGSDIMEGMGEPLKVGTNFSISLSTESKEEADRLFAGLSTGGKADMPMQDTFWGSYFGMLTDTFGIQWMVSYDANYQ